MPPSPTTTTNPTIQITFDVTEPETHLVHVTQTLPPANETRTLRMAAWVPGSYKIRDFGRHVQDLTANVDGRPVRTQQTGKDAWTIPGSQGKTITLQYAVYCRELTVDTSHVTSDHAHLFPATLTLVDAASRNLPHHVTVKTPRSWRLWSGLETDALDGTLQTADNYDHLIDCPIEAGPPNDYHEDSFTVRRKKHRIILWKPPHGMDAERIRKDTRAIVETTARIFDGLPYNHYTFLGHVALEHGGGLEHRNSTVLGIDPLHLVADEQIKTKLLPLVAHEFFHTWNVKRILPAAFTPYDLQVEVYTELLWLFEGFTTYYELPILARAGVVDEDAWGKIAAEMLQYYEMAIGRKRISVADASRLTWTLLYQPHEHNVNRNVSYYTKGLFVGLCLDAHLRTHGIPDGLDTVMRHIWQNHGSPDAPGIPEDGFANLVQEATGLDVARLLGRWIHGTTELPVDKALRELGWNVKRDWKDPKKKLGLGVHFKKGTSTIERIPEDGPAYRVLQPDDELIAIEGQKWSTERFAEIAATREAGQEIELSFFREGRLRTTPVPLREVPPDKIEIKVHKGNAGASRRRTAWLGTLETKS